MGLDNLGNVVELGGGFFFLIYGRDSWNGGRQDLGVRYYEINYRG